MPQAPAYRYSNDLIDEGDDDNLPIYCVTAEHVATGEIIGQANYVHSRDGARVILSGDIHVDPDHRHRGVATGLMHHLADLHHKPVDPNGFTEDGLGLWQALGWPTFGS